MINLSLPEVALHFVPTSDDRWHCQQTKVTIGGAILDFYCHYGSTDLCGLTYLGLPLTNEISIPDVPGTLFQRFERGVLIVDPQHILDNPPGAGNIYVAHLYHGPGQDPRLHAALEQIKVFQVQLLQAQHSTPQLNDYRTKLNQINNLSKI